MGAAGFAFVLVFSPYIGHIAASSAVILYRLSTYFLPFLISMIVFFKTQRQMLAGKWKEREQMSVKPIILKQTCLYVIILRIISIYK